MNIINLTKLSSEELDNFYMAIIKEKNKRKDEKMENLQNKLDELFREIYLAGFEILDANEDSITGPLYISEL